MEDLIVSFEEHQILQKYKSNLEGQYNVKMSMPEIKTDDSCVSQDVIFISIVGSEQNINNVKKFLRKKMEASVSYEEEGDISVIVINSDSDEEQDYVSKYHGEPKKKKRKTISVVDLSWSPVHVNNQNNDCEKLNTTVELNDTIDMEETRFASGSRLPDFIPLNDKQNSTPENSENSIPFISNENMFAHTSNVTPNENEEDVIVLSSEEEEIPRPITPVVRLRPIVIDGSNVARAHGKKTKTYSCKGIKISIEYFLNRGHTEVTAFVPLFRRHCKRGHIITTDQDILDELENSQHVVFTPSRRVEGKNYTCYDDRFIVELAASTGGVILSNDNYRDLLDESPEFKETIQNRLLMFCFVGDKLMVPNDPLGAKGPKLSEFLAFPPT